MLHVYISREVDGESTILSQGCIPRAELVNNEWHHLAISVPPINVRKGGTLLVNLRSFWF